ncbi:MAG TPA: MBG domain-containing protein, partial [Acidimicrobiales bacterium]
VVTGGGGAGGISTANGPGTPANGGSGAQVTNATFAATDNDVENVNVGGGGQPGSSSNGGGGSSSVAAGGSNQIIAGAGGGAGEDYSGGAAGSAGTSAPGCTLGGGNPGNGGTGGLAATSASCGAGAPAPQNGGNGDGGKGGDGYEGSTLDGAGGAGSGSGAGGNSSAFSGAGGGGYGGGSGGYGGSGGAGGGSTGGTVTLAGNGGSPGAQYQQTPGGPGGNGEVVISWQYPPPPSNINAPTISGTGHPGNNLMCNTSASDWNGSPSEFRYEFLEGSTVVQPPSQTQDTYALGDSDAGSTVTCAVSASNNGGPSAFIPSSNSIAVTQPLTITGPSPTIDYGQADPTLTPGYSGLINGDLAPSTPATCSTSPSTPTQVGHYTVTCSGAADPDYSFTYQTGTLTISAVDLLITAPSATINYGAPLPAFHPEYSGLTGGDAATTTPPTCGPTPTTPKNAGTYPVTCTGAADGNYNITYAAGTLKILPIPLTITAPSATVLDGQAPNLTPTYTGFVAGDGPSSLSTQPTCTTTYDSTAFPLPLPGPYPSSCSGAVDGNYVITYVAGNFTVYLHALPGAVDLVGPDGGVFALGNPNGFLGSLPGIGIHVNDIVGISSTPDDHGYYLVGRDGGVFAFGDAQYFGSLPGLGLHVGNIVGIVATPDNGGYYLVGKDGGVFTFGDAVYQGSLPDQGQSVNDVVGIALPANGGGYWLARASGAVAHFGGAASLGNAPGGGIVSITATQNGSGYWLTSAGGGMFNYGNAPYQGSIPGLGLSVSDIITTVASPNGGGYLMVGSDGGTFAFPNELFPGSLGGTGLTFVGAAPTG